MLSLLEGMFKVSPISLNARLQPFSKPQHCLVDGILGQIIPYDLQDSLQL